MREIVQEALPNMNFENIEIDIRWNFNNDFNEHKMHRIHAYPAKFPAFIVSQAIEDMEKERSIKTVGDIFCGCGTTAYEAMLNEKSFWGCDINPVAVLIAKTKSNLYKDECLLGYFDLVERNYLAVKNKITAKDIDGLNPRLHYWFVRDNCKDLFALLNAINKSIPHNSKYKRFFLVAFSNILKSTSKWLQKSIKPTIDKNKPIRSVWNTFNKQFNLMKAANLENISQITKKNKIEIRHGSVLSVRSNAKIDLLVSSPPYVTSYEYADLHQLSTLWLGYTNDYKDLRKGTIGSVFNGANFAQYIKLMPSGRKNVNELFKLDKSRSKYVAKYFAGIQRSVQKSFNLLTNNGQAIFVIGNTEYKGVRIDNAKHLVESMFKAGFKKIFITKRKISNKSLTPYRTQTGKFATAENSTKRIYAEEFIVKGIK